MKKLHLQQVETKGHRCWMKNFKKTDKRRPKILKSKFPKWNPLDSSFNATLNERGEVEVMLTDTRKAVPHVIIDADGNVNEREIKKSKKIQNSLGPPAEDIIRTKEEEISRREKKIQELQASLETASENQREQIDPNIEEQENEISRLEAENERIEERMSLRDRVKLIFKKYGFTVFAVVSAVGLVIGVIVSNLKKGLTSLGKGVGGALKNIGKKIGEILPGMIGAIASFVFKTAGEAVGFLAKNAWLLILAAVMFMIEKFKRNKVKAGYIIKIKMKLITVKSKETTVSVDLVPPLVLGDKQRVSLVDIRIPEQYFEFTKDQAIGDDGRYKNQLKIVSFSKHLGKYNARRLQQVLNGDSLKAELGLEISITDKAAYLTTQSKEVIVSAELTKNFNIPRILKPYSAVKISGDEKYFVFCDLVENNNSLLSGEKLRVGRLMPSKLLAVAPKSESGVYPELLIPADKRVINNITLRIENEKFEVPDFNDEPIIYVLKIS